MKKKHFMNQAQIPKYIINQILDLEESVYWASSELKYGYNSENLKKYNSAKADFFNLINDLSFDRKMIFTIKSFEHYNERAAARSYYYKVRYCTRYNGKIKYYLPRKENEDYE